MICFSNGYCNKHISIGFIVLWTVKDACVSHEETCKMHYTQRFSGVREWTISLLTGSGLIIWDKWPWSTHAEVRGWLPFFLLPEASPSVCVRALEPTMEKWLWIPILGRGDAGTLLVAVHSCHFTVPNLKNPKKQMDSIEYSFIFQKIGFAGVSGDRSPDKVIAVKEWRPEARRTHMLAWQLRWLPVIQHSEDRIRASLEKAG